MQDRVAEASDLRISREPGKTAQNDNSENGTSVGEGQHQSLFAIVQGGMDRGLRRESAQRTIEIGFPGSAIGGPSVGEQRALTRALAESTIERLSKDHPP